MNNGLKILATASALPKRHLTNDDLEKMVETTDEWIVTRTGIRERRICEEENQISLAIEAATKVIAAAKAKNPAFDETQIGGLFVATSTEEQLFPSTACMVQKHLGLPENMLAYDLTAACSGFIFGMQMAHAFLKSTGMKYILLIGSEHLSKIVDYEDRSTCILFGDGAGAALLTLAEDDKVGYFANHWVNGNDEALFCRPGEFMTMNGQEVFRFATRVIGSALEALLTESGLTIEDIDHVVCHQANKRIIDHVKRKYPGHEEKFFMNIETYGNTSAASIPIALDEMNQKGILKPGDKVVCVGFGAGLTWGSTLVTI